jgi:hypothetical protein
MNDQPEHQHLKDGQLRGILIDPYTKTVKVVHVDPYPAWKELIQCDTITSVPFGIHEDTHVNETLWCDDEILLHATDDTRYFQIENYPQPLGGRGIILGTDQAGETVSSAVPLAFVQRVTSWPDVKFSHITYDDPSDEKHEVFGSVVVHRQHAHFVPRTPGSNPDTDEVD